MSAELEDGPRTGKLNPRPAVVWTFAAGGPADRFHLTQGTVAVHGGIVVAGDFTGNVHCLDATTGVRHWIHATKDTVFGNPLVVDGKVYVGTGDGIVWVLAAGTTTQVVGKVEMNRPVVAGPVFANGVLYVLTDGHLYAIAANPNGRVK